MHLKHFSGVVGAIRGEKLKVLKPIEIVSGRLRHPDRQIRGYDDFS